MRRVLAAVIVGVLALGGAARAAHAGERDAAADDDALRPDEDAPADGASPARVPFGLTLNPGAFLIGKYGGNFEYSMMPHHALTVSAAYVSQATSDSKSPDHVRGLALEVGWRFYTGTSGPVGAFFGPSLMAGAYSDDSPNGEMFDVLGGAIDVGFQTKIAKHFLFGAGVGVQTTSPSVPYRATMSSLGSSSTTWSGALPRALLMLGGTFGHG
jgi:hypothetical protein